jgi:hypothetical protein
VSYRIVTVERGGRWVARAEREESGTLFGSDCTGATEDEAFDRLSRWLAWHQQHGAALAELQAAERVYHRAMIGVAANGSDGSITEVKKAALDALDTARKTLDGIRARQPETSS